MNVYVSETLINPKHSFAFTYIRLDTKNLDNCCSN